MSLHSNNSNPSLGIVLALLLVVVLVVVGPVVVVVVVVVVVAMVAPVALVVLEALVVLVAVVVVLVVLVVVVVVGVGAGAAGVAGAISSKRIVRLDLFTGSFAYLRLYVPSSSCIIFPHSGFSLHLVIASSRSYIFLFGCPSTLRHEFKPSLQSLRYLRLMVKPGNVHFSFTILFFSH